MLRIIWDNITKGGTHRFLGLHIRRGDKIVELEMEDIPMENYTSVLISLCENLNIGTGSKNFTKVFVMHDDPVAYEQVKDILGQRLTLVELPDLLTESDFGHLQSFISGDERGDEATAWQRHTRELILSMTLMAMADQVVCTFSSNLCKLMALLKGNLDVFHSLDQEWSAL